MFIPNTRLRIVICLIFLGCLPLHISAQETYLSPGDWSPINKIIYKAFSTSKLSLMPQEASNGALFFFEPTENGKKLELITHIVFNERSTTEYVELLRGIADGIKRKLLNLDYCCNEDERIIVVPLAVIDSGMSYNTSTVFHKNPEARRLMQFYSEREEYDLRIILRIQQSYRHGRLKGKE